jgi:hypothetical protein
MIKQKYNHHSIIKVTISIFFCVIFYAGCDKEEDLHNFKKYNYREGTILTFSSELHSEQFIVQKVIDGKYENSSSGTCSKSPMTAYEYQAVYLRPADSVDRWFPMIGSHADDCSAYPKLLEGKGIASFNGVFNALENDRINWLDEFYGKISDFNRQHPKITIRTREFTNVFEYTVTSEKRLATIYYSHRQGFVGYVLANGEVFELINP